MLQAVNFTTGLALSQLESWLSCNFCGGGILAKFSQLAASSVSSLEV